MRRRRNAEQPAREVCYAHHSTLDGTGVESTDRRPAMIAIALALLAAGTDAWLDQTRARWEQVSRQIWGFHETALKETRSSALLADVLEKEGFQVRRGVGPLPTAFVATAGSGKPVVAILAEYDALPELSQKGGEAQKAPVA